MRASTPRPPEAQQRRNVLASLMQRGDGRWTWRFDPVLRRPIGSFLDHDSVPWNNNNAEHAVKRFAHYREVVDGEFSEPGLNDYLMLLSIYVTCRYKEVGFLQFLLSQEKDIDSYCASIKRRRPLPTIELCPEGSAFSRRKR